MCLAYSQNNPSPNGSIPLTNSTNQAMRSPATSNERRPSYRIHCPFSQGLSSKGEKQAPMRRYLQSLQRVASERLGSSISDIRIEDDNASMVPDSFAHTFSCLDFDPHDFFSYDANGGSETLLDASFREKRWETPEHHAPVTQAPSGTITCGTTSETASQLKRRSPPHFPQRQASLEI